MTIHALESIEQVRKQERDDCIEIRRQNEAFIPCCVCWVAVHEYDLSRTGRVPRRLHHHQLWTLVACEEKTLM
jgi:hypothetical protein